MYCIESKHGESFESSIEMVNTFWGKASGQSVMMDKTSPLSTSLYHRCWETETQWARSSPLVGLGNCRPPPQTKIMLLISNGSLTRPGFFSQRIHNYVRKNWTFYTNQDRREYSGSTDWRWIDGRQVVFDKAPLSASVGDTTHWASQIFSHDGKFCLGKV